MPKRRLIIPKALKDRLLAEYNHRCSICGGDRPQIHHIDENPENNVLLNLLPLCPNHHLNDQHNPTTKIEPLRLSLFRKYKDPQILSPQFEPLYKRIKYLLTRSGEESFESLSNFAADLVKFTEYLEMGSYYSKRFWAFLDWSIPSGYPTDQAESVMAEHHRKYHKRLDGCTDRVIELVVEMLRYQKWPTYKA